ncbi:MAG: sigma-70 family RNA polymerase sigma factor [Planctomycetes bacterium]|nr:sigma-70 family RNA polymerase sigma factor [Planctomycetota bacterium]
MSIESELTLNAQEIVANDHLLLNQYAASRSPETFVELVRRHTGLVYGTCLRITADTHDAEELTQECFFDLARQAAEIRSSLVGWLHQAATHRSLNRIRGDRRRRTHEQAAIVEREITLPKADEASSNISWSEIAPLVDQALADLPEELRTPILMRYLEGATQADVAQSLGIHQSTVSRRLTLGIETLRQSLRRAGLVIPAATLLSWLGSQSAIAAPPALSVPLGKIAVAGFGTSITTNSASTGLLAWLAAVSKGGVALLFVPLVAGILWGEVVFLGAVAAWFSYVGLRRPEWFRVLCFTRQFPNIYEWPFFPLARWRWKVPPREWQNWMAIDLISGIELLGVLAMPGGLPNRGSLLILAAALWQIFMGIRIWRRVRRCRTEFTDGTAENEWPVDGALLLTYALAGVVLMAKLCAFPWFLSSSANGKGLVASQVACCVCWGTVLIWGTILVIGRYRRWWQQGPIDSAVRAQIEALAAPPWVLMILFAVPSTFVVLFTFLALIQDDFPVYVPWGETATSVASRRMLSLQFAAMDSLVMGILPLSYLYRRIPRIAWGVAFGTVGLIGTLNLGLFAKVIIAGPVIAAPPRYEGAPWMTLTPGHFIVQNPPNLLAHDSLKPSLQYLGGQAGRTVRVIPTATIQVDFEGHIVQMNALKTADLREATLNVMAMVSPREFQNGIPTQIEISLIIVDAARPITEVEKIQLPVPADISPELWNSELNFHDQEFEKEYPLGETVTLATVQGMPIVLKVASNQPADPVRE